MNFLGEIPYPDLLDMIARLEAAKAVISSLGLNSEHVNIVDELSLFQIPLKMEAERRIQAMRDHARNEHEKQGIETTSESARAEI